MKDKCPSPRTIAFIVLLGVTAWGAVSFFNGDWRETLAHWQHRWPVLWLAFFLHLADVSFDALLWKWILQDFDIRIDYRRAWVIFFSGFAGLLLPLQLGRLIRSDGVARLGLGPLGQAARAEFVLFFMSGAGAVAIVSGILTYVIFPWAAPFVALSVVAGFLFMARPAFALLQKTKLTFPEGYWWRPRTYLLAVLTMLGWLIDGTALFGVVHGLPGAIQLWQAWLVMTGNWLLSTCTGLPGGVGAMEGFLGVSLRFLEMPPADLAFAVGAYRLATFWVWIPIGWLFLLRVNRWVGRKTEAIGEVQQSYE